MIRKPISIQFDHGLGARPIALLVQEASQYTSTVYIEIGSKQVNAKSIMGMMSLKLVGEQSFIVVADGSDEATAIKGVEDFLNKL